ncbi:hypothetical protein H6503_03965 [Candidatus Woesearchaeota archaeon]|nr:hypothetical protein [Candidatus Woesearchaeota archaeon]
MKSKYGMMRSSLVMLCLAMMILLSSCSEHDGNVQHPITDEHLDEGTIVDLDYTGFCVPGEMYQYVSAEGNITLDIIGMEIFKGNRYCKALDGNIVYYYDLDYRDFWVVHEDGSEDRIIDGVKVN